MKASKYKKDIIENFTQSIKLLETKDVKIEEDGVLYDAYEGDSISQPINEKDMEHRMIYTIDNPETFKIEDYSLRVPFGVFSMNDEAIKLDPIKVEFNNN